MLVVEPARNEDAPKVARLAANTLSEQYDAEWLSNHMTDRNAFWVARHVPTNRVVGFALAEQSGPEAHLLALAVSDQARRRGIGSTLVRTVQHDLARQGAFRMNLEVRADDPSTQGFYERLGFAPQGLEEKVYRDGGDAVRMAKPL